MAAKKYNMQDIPSAKLYAGKVKRLALSMANHGYPLEEAVAFISSAKGILDNQRPEVAAWFAAHLPELADRTDFKAICEDCACCLGGKREAAARAICKEEATLGKRIERLSHTQIIVGNRCEIVDDRTFLVHFFPTMDYYRCPCLRFEEGSQTVVMPEAYCYCCGGHLKHHIRKALGCDAEVTFITGALTTFGKEGCCFRVDVKGADAENTPAEA